VLWKYGYDQADQLTSAVKHATDTPQTVLQRFAYAYDPAGNRTVEQINDAVTLSAYDNLNRLTSQAPGGPMVIAGTLNEPGTVTISGKPAIVDANNNFRGTVPTTTGTNTFTIVAKDATENTTTQQYEVDLSGSSKSFTYDANGNVVQIGTSSVYEWDARNRLTARQEGMTRNELTYDGASRPVGVRDRENGTVTADRTLLWIGYSSIEVRSGAGTSRHFALGRSDEELTKYFYTRDHLASLRQEADESALVHHSTDYDPFGRVSATDGVIRLAAGFAALSDIGIPDFWLAARRVLLPSVGRWLSEDPFGGPLEGDGPNLYWYGRNNPIRLTDPLGLVCGTVDNDHLIPDSFVNWSFATPCQVHDDCYRDCKASKTQCDSRFLQNMKFVCKTQSGFLSPYYADCLRAAYFYYLAVRFRGKDAYKCQRCQ
jgi:RHS repeat-associated protein